VIEMDPMAILGKRTSEKFHRRLPYLFKVLAADRPLSIQAHPNLIQARQGFDRENRLGIPLDAPNRNYRDDNHKPECLCALTKFWALEGFRKISELLPLIETVCPDGLEAEIVKLRKNQNAQGLKEFFQSLMTLESGRRVQLVDEAVQIAYRLEEIDPLYHWMIALYDEYPGDIGIFSPVLLNLICLEPGQAVYLGAGELHAYLRGTGIELMANSDNVLRGGLTPKHIDVPELLNVLNFQDGAPTLLAPEPSSDTERIYSSDAEEFVLSVISLTPGRVHASATSRSAEILLCTEGRATMIESGLNRRVDMKKGASVLVPAAVDHYSMEGAAIFYKASVPMQGTTF